jgi:hypothetical protein
MSSIKVVNQVHKFAINSQASGNNIDNLPNCVDSKMTTNASFPQCSFRNTSPFLQICLVNRPLQNNETFLQEHFAKRTVVP